ncbi:MAG: hypothetical protein J6L88_10175 [Clostridia bacterium]|nr:hypothetical protein [Clostridia bacterium]
MQNFPSNGTLNTPPSEDFTNTALQGSMQNILQDNIGAYVQIEFLLGTQGMTARLGVLYAVGTGYVVLYDVGNSNYLVCDIFSIKFVTFFSPDGQNGYIFPVDSMTADTQSAVPQNTTSQNGAIPSTTRQQTAPRRPMRR